MTETTKTPNTPTPRYQHDCECCKYLGEFGPLDLYVHAGEGRLRSLPQTVIARASSEGPDYQSGMCFAFGMNEALTEARRRAEAEGHIEYPFDTALHSLKNDDPQLRAEFVEKSAQHPLMQLVLAALEGRATYEDFAGLAQAFLSEQTDALQEQSPHRYLGWFISKLGHIAELMASPPQVLAVSAWIYDQELRFEQGLCSPAQAN